MEKVDVEDRGGFYDGVGALQDVGQNHLLQMLALITMEHPVRFSADTIRKNRAEVLEESCFQNWDQQTEALKQWAEDHGITIDDPNTIRRIPTEITHDILAYYDARKQRILEKDWDWTRGCSRSAAASSAWAFSVGTASTSAAIRAASPVATWASAPPGSFGNLEY